MQSLVDRLGLCSVTLRQLSPTAVADAAVRAGLTSVEWGADVHARPDRPDDLAQVRDLTAHAGLRVASYGSYWRAGVHDVAAGRLVVGAAAVLGAPRVRIWAGDVGSRSASSEARDDVVASTRELAAVAADHGLLLAFEFHGDTVADSAPSLLDLLDRVDDPAVRTYWQPPVGEIDEVALAGLDQVVDAVEAVHVFSWWPATERHPLVERAGLWRGVVQRLARQPRPVDLLMEFVVDDRPDVLVPDAADLRRMVEGVAS